MKQLLLKFVKLSVLFMVFLFLTSCTVENQLSTDFKKHSDSVSVLIVGSSHLQKVSAVIQKLYPQYSDLSPELQDTVWKHQTKFLDSVGDSVILESYYKSIVEQLKKTNLKIYTDKQVDEFVKQSGEKWIFRVAQIQLEEDKQKVDFSKEMRGEEELYKDMEIEVLSINTWFEVFKSENDTTPFNIVYGQQTVSDEVKGRFFETLDGKYEFRYKRTDLTKEDVLKLATSSGKKNAQQIADYIFTKYVRIFYPESESVYGFNIEGKKFYKPAENDQFNVIN